jgi:bifunctional polynucleotide phosphatase/kinase
MIFKIDFNIFLLKMSDSLIIISSKKIIKTDEIVKIASFDLDHTLIKPKSGKTFPIDKFDWKILNDFVIPKLHSLHSQNYKLVIFSNQGGVNKHSSIDDIIFKCKSISKFINLPIIFYLSILDDMNRKPRIGMWEDMNECKFTNIDMNNSFYCGDAAGRYNDFSSTDYKFAANLNLKFYIPEKIFNFAQHGYDPQLNSLSTFNPKTYFKSKSIDYVREILNIKENKVIILVGSPASGKSTICGHFSNFKCINQDDLKTLSKCKKELNNCLKNADDIIIDNTNRNIKTRANWIDIIKPFTSYKIICINIIEPKEVSMHINCYRMLTSNKKIPAIAIHTYYKNYEAPQLNEGFDKIINTTFGLCINSFDDISNRLFTSYLL